MKKLTALLLIMLMIAAVFASCRQQESATPSGDTSVLPTDTSAESAPGTDTSSELPVSDPSTDTGTPDPVTGSHEDVYSDDDDRSDIPDVKVHQMLDYLPSSYSLIGTKHLPPIDDQGGIGSCASEGITYMQFTNAVSRYIESIGIDPNWNPSSGNEKYIFAPKFTYNFAGAGTAWVYDILRDHGAMLLDDWHFYTTEYGTKTGTTKNNRNPLSLNWPVDDGQLEGALNYRITDYEQIWTNSFGNQLTNTDRGKEIIVQIKDAICQGNVVVTGGFSSNWKYSTVTSKDAKAGTGKVGESACVWCNGTGGGHQVSIVGYDDDFVCSLDGVQLRGAFLVANSWGTWWKNNGYFWVMYDSINKVSEHPELNDAEKYEGRTNSMDQFCFIYWDKDIEIGLPEAYVSVDMTITDREGFYVEVIKTDRNNVSTSYMPSLFTYGMNFNNVRGSRDTLESTDKYVTFSGLIDTKAEEGILTFGFQNLLSKGEKFDDYNWGIKLYSTFAPFTVNKLTLYDGTGNARAQIAPPSGVKDVDKGSSRTFVFDLGMTPKTNHFIGSYNFKNVKSALYVGAKGGMLLTSAASADDAVQFDVDFDFFNRVHVIKRETYVLDIRGSIPEDGKQIQFNRASASRKTQSWKVVELEDGTFNIRLASDPTFAIGMKDGAIMLVSGTDVWDYGRWYLENADDDAVSLSVGFFGTSLKVTGAVPARVSVNTLTVSVYATNGTLVKSYEVKVGGDKIVDLELAGLEKGSYLFTFESNTGKYVSASYYYTF